MINHRTRRQVGQTGLSVPALGFGGATLGDAHGPISEHQATAAVEAAYWAGIDFFDTSPWYGNGKSELRIGSVLRTKPRGSFVLSTKVGRVYARCTEPDHPSQSRWRGGLPFAPSFDYTRDGVLRSYEQSLLRLGIGTVDALIIHDIDEGHQKNGDGVEQRLRELETEGGFEALTSLKRSGEIAAIGAGINRLGMIPQFLSRFDIDFFLVAMPYTLLNQEAIEDELPSCVARGVSVIIGAPFASGILASGPASGASYGYQPAPKQVMEKAQEIVRVCERYKVPLGAAALQFPLAHPAVVSIIPGPNHPEQVRANLQWFSYPIPGEFWEELKARSLLHPDAPTPMGAGKPWNE